jgi:hypothetical protein
MMYSEILDYHHIDQHPDEAGGAAAAGGLSVEQAQAINGQKAA